MRADLLDALASVDWAESKLPAFEARLEAWLDGNIDITVVDNPSPATHDSVVAREKGFLQLELGVEAGAYINAIRSSLDILACAIGKREMTLTLTTSISPWPTVRRTLREETIGEANS